MYPCIIYLCIHAQLGTNDKSDKLGYRVESSSFPILVAVKRVEGRADDPRVDNKEKLWCFLLGSILMFLCSFISFLSFLRWD